MANKDYSNTYHEAIHTLRKSFGVDGNSVKFELIPTVMCLALAEMMIPDSAAAIAEHIKAAGLLFQAYGPDACKEGFGHKLFAGFRPLLTMQAIQQRQPVFLALPAWIDTPFSRFDPSLMQQLLNEAVMLPSLLHQADTVVENPELSSQPDRVEQILDIFINFASRLDNFETVLCADGCPPYWPHGDAKDAPLPFWYPNITLANAFTYLWALKIIYMGEMKRLSTYLPRDSPKDSLSPGRLHLSLAENDLLMVVLARQIQLSMEYLLQDEMELFGPSSTFFPLKVAYQIFKMDKVGFKVEIACIEKYLDVLDDKGLLSARSFVFGR
ncbi:hypothetical protein N7494_008013 [Penicillium frequentans]|uniref:Uncharacterized protein n=1 Tax=Penicillium frequentans TaxID=3151616 RepID=A0AAD6CTL5_9EURO|nr:hypothetical protein N7494_008013 [Penicillium glabrum]